MCFFRQHYPLNFEAFARKSYEAGFPMAAAFINVTHMLAGYLRLTAPSGLGGGEGQASRRALRNFLRLCVRTAAAEEAQGGPHPEGTSGGGVPGPVPSRGPECLQRPFCLSLRRRTLGSKAAAAATAAAAAGGGGAAATDRRGLTVLGQLFAAACMRLDLELASRGAWEHEGTDPPLLSPCHSSCPRLLQVSLQPSRGLSVSRALLHHHANHQHHSRDHSSNHQPHSRDHCADHQPHSRDHCADHQHHSRDRCADHQHHSRDHSANHQHHSRDHSANHPHNQRTRSSGQAPSSRDTAAAGDRSRASSVAASRDSLFTPRDEVKGAPGAGGGPPGPGAPGAPRAHGAPGAPGAPCSPSRSFLAPEETASCPTSGVVSEGSSPGSLGGQSSPQQGQQQQGAAPSPREQQQQQQQQQHESAAASPRDEAPPPPPQQQQEHQQAHQQVQQQQQQQQQQQRQGGEEPEDTLLHRRAQLCFGEALKEVRRAVDELLSEGPMDTVSDFEALCKGPAAANK
ncbi:ELMO/CED-12 family domain-containing protein, putative [Eimeria brunetti]|uniref:ELMO/CED-12 family domain-containing protein, putative n=1 Tax=Eimeria brunetti TaxID=51314 RepID=U6LRS1_9EIME|nr:ELMO/CED-12 family domain-containing protein, putative [Eimeria brunetti]